MKRYGLILAIALAIFWLALSGFFMPLLLIFGGISILLTLWLCARMLILDQETAPYLFVLPTLGYFVWLGKEIYTANIAVVRAVLNPDMNVSPTMVRVPMNRKTDIGAVMFANSITLTPGTVSVQMDEDAIVVHTLLSEMAAAEDFEPMEERSGFAVGEGTQ